MQKRDENIFQNFSRGGGAKKKEKNYFSLIHAKIE